LKIHYTNQFKKDYKRIKKQNKDVNKLRTVVEKLAAKELLEARYRDHSLSGNWKGFRDCHVEPDWLLIYKRTEDTLILERTGLPLRTLQKIISKPSNQITIHFGSTAVGNSYQIINQMNSVTIPFNSDS